MLTYASVAKDKTKSLQEPNGNLVLLAS